MIRIINIVLIIYQKILSPMLHTLSMGTVVGGCRFYPSCSEYCKQTIKKYGICSKSIKLIVNRLLRCRSFFLDKSKADKYSGYDPIQ